MKKAWRPDTREQVELPDDVQPGDLITFNGKTFRVTYEYGAYALEEPT